VVRLSARLDPAPRGVPAHTTEYSAARRIARRPCLGLTNSLPPISGRFGPGARRITGAACASRADDLNGII